MEGRLCNRMCQNRHIMSDDRGDSDLPMSQSEASEVASNATSEITGDRNENNYTSLVKINSTVRSWSYCLHLFSSSGAIFFCFFLTCLTLLLLLGTFQNKVKTDLHNFLGRRTERWYLFLTRCQGYADTVQFFYFLNGNHSWLRSRKIENVFALEQYIIL